MASDHPQSDSSEPLADAMQAALTDEIRVCIIGIEEAMLEEASVRGIEICKAVIQGGIRRPDELKKWSAEHETPYVTDWCPSV